jgi:hypothetical protein
MAELLVRPLPEGVDPSKMEMYLSDGEFKVCPGRFFVVDPHQFVVLIYPQVLHRFYKQSPNLFLVICGGLILFLNTFKIQKL